MPKRFAIATGNWSDTSTWDSGNILGIPTSSDDVWANGSTVNVNQSFIVNSLNNNGTTTNTSGRSAPMVTQNAIPMMTSFTTPEGLAFASNYVVNGEPWKAFDGTITGWQSSINNTGSVGYQFTSPKNIKRYAWRPGSSVANTPSRWTFEGSNDNTTYTVLSTVTASLAAEAVYTSTLLANTASFSFYRMNISAVNTINNVPIIRELEMTESTSSATGGASGGAYNFNTADVSASILSTSTPISLVANNSITVTATTGTVNISAPFAALTGLGTATTQIINHTGNCNFIITGSSFTAGIQNSAHCINKSSTGTITVIGNLVGYILASAPNTTAGLNSTAGNTVVIGNIVGSLTTTAANNSGLIQSAGSLTVIGNVNGGILATTNYGINFSGTSLTITGSITGGSGTNAAAGINITGTPTINISGSVNGASAVGIQSATANTTNIEGNVIGSGAAGISYTGAATLTITGSLIAGTGAVAAASTSTSATTIVRGNLVNTNGIMAFYGPRLRLASGSLTTWQFTSSTGTDRTLYTLQQIGDQPSPSNVRTGVVYASGSLTGTMAVPPSDSVALGVPVDNTTGSAVLNPTYVADEIWNQPTSTLTVSGSIGERIKNAATVQSTGAQIAALAGGN
jgi:hypothetical protein